MAQHCEEFLDSLSALSEKIREAEALLQEQPGSMSASVHLRTSCEAEGFGDECFLEVTQDGDGNSRICVRDYANNPPSETLLVGFPASKRIKLSASIKELLDKAAS